MKQFDWPQWLTAAAGFIYVVSASLMFISPHWFYDNIGHFPPFNRHYIGDVAAFTLPLGVGLLIAARDLQRFRGLLFLGLAASLLHMINHFADAIGQPVSHWLMDFVPLALLACALLVSLIYGPERRESRFAE